MSACDVRGLILVAALATFFYVTYIWKDFSVSILPFQVSLWSRG